MAIWSVQWYCGQPNWSKEHRWGVRCICLSRAVPILADQHSKPDYALQSMILECITSEWSIDSGWGEPIPVEEDQSRVWKVAWNWAAPIQGKEQWWELRSVYHSREVPILAEEPKMGWQQQQNKLKVGLYMLTGMDGDWGTVIPAEEYA